MICAGSALFGGEGSKRHDRREIDRPIVPAKTAAPSYDVTG